jgi:hypothetical protein
MGVAGAGPRVLVERLAGPVAERQGTLPAALADHQHHAVLEVQVARAHARDLGTPAAGIQEQQDQGAVAARLDIGPAGTGQVDRSRLEEAIELGDGVQVGLDRTVDLFSRAGGARRRRGGLR